jgi:hypothetical protein
MSESRNVYESLSLHAGWWSEEGSSTRSPWLLEATVPNVVPPRREVTAELCLVITVSVFS